MFPQAIARAQRDELQRTMIEAKRLINTTVEDLRDLQPNLVALTRSEYDAVLTRLVSAQSSLSSALDAIDESLARQAREQAAEDLAAVEQEAEGREE
jgi:ABC-type transporter Mla subunit MlaD